MKIKSYEDLDIYQRSDNLAYEIYQLTNKLPKSEQYGIISQIKRCVVSIPANIVEGYSRHHTKEFVQFLYISLGSLYEVEYYLKFIVKLRYIKKDKINGLLNEIEILKRMIGKLIKVLKSKY